MLWLMVLVLLGGLAFVMFHKPEVKSMGAGWIPPDRREAEAKAAAAQQAALAAPPAASAARMPDTFDFNDLYGAKPTATPTDRTDSSST